MLAGVFIQAAVVYAAAEMHKPPFMLAKHYIVGAGLKVPGAYLAFNAHHGIPPFW